MRIVVFLLMFLVFIPAIGAAGDSSSGGMEGMSMPMPESSAPAASDTAQPAAGETVYICPMHPHIHGKEGDTCPICGMKMVPRTSTDAPAPEENREGALYIEPAYKQALGVKTGTVGSHVFGKTIHAFGHVAPSTRLEHIVSVRTAGWIVDLNTDAIGDTVKAGDLLFTFYSPDLMRAQSDYMAGQRGGAAVGDPAQRLRLYGMGDRTIEELKKKGRFLEKTPFYAPIAGTVSALNTRKGAYVKEGDAILTLQDYSKVWVLAHVPLKDMQFLSAGAPATIMVNDTGEVFRTRADFIYPATDPQSRNGLVRLVLDNPDGKLKTDMLTDVTFAADSRERLAVPEEAVLYGGRGAYVIEALKDGRFRPVMTRTGITSEGMTEIISGLSDGQNVVTSGQFMIDAESNLSGGMANMAGMEMGNGHQ